MKIGDSYSCPRIQKVAMLDEIRGRGNFIRDLLRQHVYGWIIAALSFFYALFSFWRDEFATPDQQAKLRAVSFLPDWPTAWWIIICLTVLVVWVFEAAYRIQRPGMRLLFKEAPRTIASGLGPMRYLISVGLRNGSGHRLNNCRIQLQINSHDGFQRPEWVRHPVCAPFSLSPDEIHYIDILSYEFDVKDAPLEVPLFHRQGDEWIKNDGAMILVPGRHDLVVEALSDNSRIARMTLELENKNDRWWINGESTSAG